MSFLPTTCLECDRLAEEERQAVLQHKEVDANLFAALAALDTMPQKKRPSRPLRCSCEKKRVNTKGSFDRNGPAPQLHRLT
jgi:hypothetical protein